VRAGACMAGTSRSCMSMTIRHESVDLNNMDAAQRYKRLFGYAAGFPPDYWHATYHMVRPA
jgi:hypothetical protein